ncbi:Spo0E family sporulation regulatory protein-aspartic acid phosphatase [Oceanobacillus sp. 1P07AA]|uniref:Spo0E family sporulation regulatory protein-aspartic acid phosphatase n=1 Tax=Oceanobacillus sp. 1P07AA TaxID=3132293 RepID=UPI0039A447D2
MYTKVKKNDRESILLSIVKKRNEMLRIAEEDGLSSENTIICSQELDNLLNQLNKYANLPT